MSKYRITTGSTNSSSYPHRALVQGQKTFRLTRQKRNSCSVKKKNEGSQRRSKYAPRFCLFVGDQSVKCLTERSTILDQTRHHILLPCIMPDIGRRRKKKENQQQKQKTDKFDRNVPMKLAEIGQIRLSCCG